MTALEKLIEAVEAGNATEFQFHTWRPGLTGTIKESKTMVRAYKGSLDAALALHEALLPGCYATISTGGDVTIYQNVSVSGTTWAEASDAEAETPARAWLLAILRAYRSTHRPERA